MRCEQLLSGGLLTAILWAVGPGVGGRVTHAEVQPTNQPAQRVRAAYETARARFLAASNSVEAAWQFSRACFDLAEQAREGQQREALGWEGVAAARVALRREPTHAAAHYYLGMNLGQVARVRRYSALRLIGEMEQAFLAITHVDERFDYAGAHRNLGLLYGLAPGWPLSIGNRSKARHHLERAVTLVPEYPENWLFQAEAHRRWNEPQKLARVLAQLDENLPRAREQFAGGEWESAWANWERHRAKLQRLVTPSGQGATAAGRTK